MSLELKGMRQFFSVKFITGLFFIVVAIPLLLSNCDLMGGSITEFIEYNTGNISVRTVRTVEQNSSERIRRTGQAWMYESITGYDKGVIELEVIIDNPHQYDLVVTPVIDEFIGQDGVRILNPAPKWPISSSRVSADTYTVSIGTTDNRVERGDSFLIHLDIATVDGVRAFKPYEISQKIIYDNPLEAPSVPSIGISADDDYDNIITWRTQSFLDPFIEHVGINEISIVISHLYEPIADRVFNYEYNGSNWNLKDLSIEGAEHYNELKMSIDPVTNRPIFELPFPYVSGGYVDSIFLAEEMSVIVTVKDKNGIYAIAGLGAHPGTYLDDLTIWYLYSGETQYRKSDFEYIRNVVEYGSADGIQVPNSVERVKFVATPNPEYPEQQILWGTSSQSEIEKSFPLLPGGTRILELNIS